VITRPNHMLLEAVAKSRSTIAKHAGEPRRALDSLSHGPRSGQHMVPVVRGEYESEYI
jgi:hypothetical protein